MAAVMTSNVVKITILLVVVASVCADACDVCGTPVYKPPTTPKSAPKTPTTPKSAPKTPSAPNTCPVSVAKLGVCSPLLGGLLGGLLPTGGKDCCALLGLLGLDVEVCLCLALDANVLGLISLHAKVDAIVTILTSCGYTVPPNFSCPV